MSRLRDDQAKTIETAIDALYRGPLDRFTAARNALAAELRKSGDREGADYVKALAKPGVTAWAVNQAWWNSPEAFRAMLDAGEQLRAAHQAFAGGQASDVRAAVDARQRAVDGVIDEAIDALGGPAKVAADARHRIAGTIETLASSGVPSELTIGRLSADLQPTGFAALGGFAAAVSSSPPSRPPRPVIVSRTPPPADKTPRTSPAEARAEAATRAHVLHVEQAEARLRSSEEALQAATADAVTTSAAEAAARQALDASTARVANLEVALEQAHEAERAARRALAEATRAASEAEMIAARTTRDVTAARERLESLQKNGDRRS